MFNELRRINELWPDERTSTTFIVRHAYWRKKKLEILIQEAVCGRKKIV
jgi:hypothetical protein